MIRTLKSKKGITIIALIITVVVLLILAGISVSLVVDKDGLLNSSKETKEEVRAKMIEQKKEVWSLENQLNKGTSQEITLEQFLESLETDGMITSEEKQEIIEVFARFDWRSRKLDKRRYWAKSEIDGENWKRRTKRSWK